MLPDTHNREAELTVKQQHPSTRPRFFIFDSGIVYADRMFTNKPYNYLQFRKTGLVRVHLNVVQFGIFYQFHTIRPEFVKE